MTTKFSIGDKVKIVEKEYPTTGIKYFDFVITSSYLTSYKHHFGKTGEVKRYDEYDDVYSVWLDSDGSQISVPAYFLELYIEVEVGSIIKDCGVDGVVIQVRHDGSCIVLWSDGNVTVNSDRYVRENATGQKIEEWAVKQHLKDMFCAM